MAVLTACGGSRTASLPAAPFARERAGAAKGPFLYVSGSSLSQYALDSSKPLHSVTEDAPYGPLVLDHAGRLIAVQGDSGFAVFDARSLTRLKFVSASYPTSIAVDLNDDIYVANCGGAVAVFSPGGMKRVGEIRETYGACTVAVGPQGNLYVVNGYYQIDVYAVGKKPGFAKLLRRIRDGLSLPDALAFGPSGELFVANYPVENVPGSIAVYAPKGTSPERTITDGVNSPWAIAVDSAGTLYVGNDPLRWRHDRAQGSVTVYVPSSDKPFHRITREISGPLALTTDSAGNAYVGCAYVEVTVFGAKGTKLLRTIKQQVTNKDSIVIGS